MPRTIRREEAGLRPGLARGAGRDAQDLAWPDAVVPEEPRVEARQVAEDGVVRDDEGERDGLEAKGVAELVEVTLQVADPPLAAEEVQ